MTRRGLRPVPGEVWFAWQLFFSHERIRLEPSDSSNGTAHIPIVRHPALVLAYGDSKRLGYLVCYFSTKCGDERNPEHARCGRVLEGTKTTYSIVTAPQYCPLSFLLEPYRDQQGSVVRADPNLRKLVTDKMAWATGIRKDASAGLDIAIMLNTWFAQMQSNGSRVEERDTFAETLDTACQMS